MKKKSSRKKYVPDYIDVGINYGRIIPRMGDMSWLGDPPTEEQSKRYEAKRKRVLDALADSPEATAAYQTAYQTQFDACVAAICAGAIGSTGCPEEPPCK